MHEDTSTAITARLRQRMGHGDAHYGGNLVDGARVLQMFGDLVTEIAIITDGDEGLLSGYSSLEFRAPVHAGDFIEATATLVRRTRLRRTVEFVAHKVVAARYERHPTAAEVLAEPVVVCRAVGTTVVPARPDRTDALVAGPVPAGVVGLHS